MLCKLLQNMYDWFFTIYEKQCIILVICTHIYLGFDFKWRGRWRGRQRDAKQHGSHIEGIFLFGQPFSVAGFRGDDTLLPSSGGSQS